MKVDPPISRPRGSLSRRAPKVAGPTWNWPAKLTGRLRWLATGNLTPATPRGSRAACRPVSVRLRLNPARPCRGTFQANVLLVFAELNGFFVLAPLEFQAQVGDALAGIFRRGELRIEPDDSFRRRLAAS